MADTSVHCGYFARGECRSCGWIEQPYAAQLARKQADARTAVPDLNETDWLPAIGSVQAGFRNKAKMAVGGTLEQPVLGLNEPGRGAVDLNDCLLYPAAIHASFAPLREFIRNARLPPYDLGSQRGELKFLLLTYAEGSGELMLRLVLRSREPLDRIRKHLPGLQASLPALTVISVNLQPVHQALLEGPEEIVLSAASELLMPVNNVPLRLRPQSFFQTHTAIAAALYAQARAWVQACAPASVLDLYCGVGGFALHAAAQGRKVFGVESSVEAVASARLTAAAMALTGIEFLAGDVTDPELQEQFGRPELVIVNPPRRGLGARLCQWLQGCGARWLIYSSCNAQSLKQDLGLLPGYQPRSARLLDMFAHTAHYELIVLLQRQD